MSIASIPAVLDHVAVAAERQTDLWPRYAVDLAGVWVAGEPEPGFEAAQVRYRSGMKVEFLTPHRPELNDFLRRFLDRSGPGAHHLTFKVPDIDAALAAAEAAGYRPVGVNLSSPDWKEAFLHPKDAPGIVVQLAQSAHEWSTPRPADMPAARTTTPADLTRIVHAVADLDGALALFSGLLGGDEDDRGEDVLGPWVDVSWPGPGRVRLVDAATGRPGQSWLGGRPGRLHHLRFSCEQPQQLAGVGPDPLGLAAAEIPPEANHGVRLLLDEV